METIQKRRILWRVPLTVALAYAVFWGIWCLIAGHVPVVFLSDIIETNNPSFIISRWWDVPFSALYAIIFVYLFTNKKLTYNPSPFEDSIKLDHIKMYVALVAALLFLSIIVFGFWLNLGVSFAFGVALIIIATVIIVLFRLFWKFMCFLFSFEFWPKIGKWIIGSVTSLE